MTTYHYFPASNADALPMVQKMIKDTFDLTQVTIFGGDYGKRPDIIEQFIMRLRLENNVTTDGFIIKAASEDHEISVCMNASGFEGTKKYTISDLNEIVIRSALHQIDCINKDFAIIASCYRENEDLLAKTKLSMRKIKEYWPIASTSIGVVSADISAAYDRERYRILSEIRTLYDDFQTQISILSDAAKSIIKNDTDLCHFAEDPLPNFDSIYLPKCVAGLTNLISPR